MSLADFLASAIKPGPYSPPGLVVAVNDVVHCGGTDGVGITLTEDAIWPVSCLTKLALADMAVRTLELDRPVTAWLHEVCWPFTIRQLLTHTSGLPIDLPIEEYGRLTAKDVRDRMLAVDPVQPVGSVAYSNIGYGWIALALERITSQSLTEILWAYDLTWGDMLSQVPVVLADVRSPFTGTPNEPFNSAYWRSLRLPWCGAFGTVASVRHLLERLHPLVSDTRVTTSGGFPPGAFFGFTPSAGCVWENAAWGCGVEFRGTKRPHWIAPSVSPESYGHIGSSGVMVWRSGETTLVVAGARTTDGGWMLRQGPKASALAFSNAANPAMGTNHLSDAPTIATPDSTTNVRREIDHRR